MFRQRPAAAPRGAGTEIYSAKVQGNPRSPPAPRPRRTGKPSHFRQRLRERSSENLLDDRSMIDIEPPLAGDLQLAGVEAQLMQYRRVDVGDVVRLVLGPVAQF